MKRWDATQQSRMMYKIPKVNKVTPLPDYELADVDTFNTVHPCGTTVEWEDGQDIAPHELYELSIPAGGV